MTSAETTTERTGSSPRRRWTLLALALGALVALFALLGIAHLLMPSSEGEGGGLSELQEAIKKIEGPATAVFGTLSGLGLLAGGGMAAMGIPQGIRMMLTAGLAGGGVLLGRGLIA